MILAELAFWLYLLHQNPDKDPWFESWEYRLWFIGEFWFEVFGENSLHVLYSKC